MTTLLESLDLTAERERERVYCIFYMVDHFWAWSPCAHVSVAKLTIYVQLLYCVTLKREIHLLK